jgi:hypothetical protein
LYLIKRIKLFLKEFLKNILAIDKTIQIKKLESFFMGTSDTNVKNDI